MLDLYNFEVFFMYSRLNVKRSIAFLSIVSDFLVRLFSHSVTAEELPRVCITVLDQLGDLKKIYIQNNFPLICGPFKVCASMPVGAAGPLGHSLAAHPFGTFSRRVFRPKAYSRPT